VKSENIIKDTKGCEMKYNIETDGFYGIKFCPIENKYPNKVIITFTGSDGSFKLACKMAQYFSGIGITSLAVAYWKVKGLPNAFVKVPLESIENAIRHLKKEGFEKIGVCGVSKGGELALLSGSMFNEINGVIAISPIHVSAMGFKGMKEIEASSWSYKGEEIPYATGHMNICKVIKESILKGEPTMNFIYEDLISKCIPDSVIKVENINGPILLISPEYDSMWTSKLSCEKVIERLKNNNFKNSYQHLNYEYAYHIVFPITGFWDFFFKVERKYKKLCKETKINLDINLKKWIQDW